jgi:hypothetical protein
MENWQGWVASPAQQVWPPGAVSQGCGMFDFSEVQDPDFYKNSPNFNILATDDKSLNPA